MNAAQGDAELRLALTALRAEYLDLVLLAGRLMVRRGEREEAGRSRASLDSEAAATRRWTSDQLQEVRRRLGVKSIAMAPQLLADAERVIVHFLECAAVQLYGKAWRLIQPELHAEYAQCGDEYAADLGKYVYSRLERLRRNRDQLGQEPDELLELYDRCLKLGYQASFETKLQELDDLRGKLATELRERIQRRKGADQPVLPALPAVSYRTPALNPLLGLAALILLCGSIALGLRFIIGLQVTRTQTQLDQLRLHLEEQTQQKDKHCQ